MPEFKEEEAIEFVKKNHEDFENNEYPADLIEQMKCYTFLEWRDMIAETNNFKMNPLIKKYFDFQQLLKDEVEYSACMGGEEYYLLRVDYNGRFRFIDNDFNSYWDECIIVTIPVS